MISPLGHRQVFQTANVEAVRQAQDVSEQIQREIAKKKALDDRLSEDQASVRVVAESERIMTDEQKSGGGNQGQPPERRSVQQGKTDEPEDTAESADTHLNFLA